MISSLACTFCGYHSPTGDTDAAGWSIFFLLIVIVAVLATIGFFMVRMIRRDHRNLDPALHDDYVRPNSTT